MNFVLINQSSDARVTYATLSLIAAALNEQANGEYATYWGGTHSVRVAADPSDAKPGEVRVEIDNSHPEVPGAEAWHEDDLGLPVIKVALDTIGEMTTGNNSLSSVISHEILETLGDPGANGWQLREDGKLEARELCDRVEAFSYPASNGVMLSNFLMPAAWIPGAEAPYDFMGILATAGEIARGGYNIEAGYPSNIQSVQGHLRMLADSLEHGKFGLEARMVGEIDSLRLKRKSGPYSRTTRRGVRI